MTDPVSVMRARGVDGEISPSGRWIRLPGDHGAVYVMQAARGRGYVVWCEPPARRREIYLDPDEALQAALRFAASGGEGTNTAGQGTRRDAGTEREDQLSPSPPRESRML